MYVLLSEAGATSTRSGGLFTKCMFRAGEGGLMGGFTAGEPVREGGVRLYLEVSDIPAALESVRQAGGTVVSGREAVGGDYGYVGVFRDPSGNTVGVWAQK